MFSCLLLTSALFAYMTEKFVEHTYYLLENYEKRTTYLHRVRDSVGEDGHHLASVVNHTECKKIIS
jgi:hypothetical protein